MKSPRTVATTTVFLSLLPLLWSADFSAGNEAELRAALEKAGPGDTIILARGTWTNVTVEVKPGGKPGAPLTLRAEAPGEVIFTGTSSINFTAPWVVLEGVLFSAGAIERGAVLTFSSDHCIVRDSAIVDYNPANPETAYYWVYFNGNHNRVERCFFAGKSNHQPVVGNDLTDSRRNTFAESHFKDIPHYDRNGREVFRIWGYGGNEELGADGAYFTVERNLFEEAHGEGVEIVSLKSNHNTVRENTIVRTRGGITNRSGNYNTIVGNIVLCDGHPGAYGIRIAGKHHTVSDNYVADGDYGIHLLAGEYIERDLTGRYEPINRAGTPLGRVPSYSQPTDVTVSHNTVVNCRMEDLYFGKNYKAGWPAKQYVLLNERLRVLRNLIQKPAGGVAVQGATLDTTEPFAQFVPQGSSFAGNIVDGGEVHLPGGSEGFIHRRVELVKGADGVCRPKAPLSLGAQLGTADTPTRHPLTANDVGPGWVRTKRAAGDKRFR